MPIDGENLGPFYQKILIVLAVYKMNLISFFNVIAIG